MAIDRNKTKQLIAEGKAYLGIELGSTRIKAVLIDHSGFTLASGAHAWENRLENGVWTYSLEGIWSGLRACYASLAANVQEKYSVPLVRVRAMGVSAMMHGYMAFDKSGELLAPFRTWRNTMTGEAAAKLSEVFSFNIPQRWSIAHLYQSILSGEEHVRQIDYLTTLSGYIHWQLTGERVLGIGDCSGMFPIDSDVMDYNARMALQFDELIKEKNFPWKLLSILPKVLCAGENAGKLSEKGARLLDVSGALQSGIPFCPPEGDAGTGMCATNSVRVRTGNVSAGTSVFAMAVLESPLSSYYPEVDMVTTPAGDPVAMVHCNNCSSDLDAWVRLFREALAAFGTEPDMDTLYTTLYHQALEGDADCSGLLAYNYFSGEHVTGFSEGRPLFVRKSDSAFTLANFMRVHLCTALGALRSGMDILSRKENVALDNMTGHGGFFKVGGVGQRIMAAALKTPVTVMETAGEGGPWGMAVLAAYLMEKQNGESLAAYLGNRIFAQAKSSTIAPVKAEVDGFDTFMRRYTNGLEIEKAALRALQ